MRNAELGEAKVPLILVVTTYRVNLRSSEWVTSDLGNQVRYRHK